MTRFEYYKIITVVVVIISLQYSHDRVCVNLSTFGKVSGDSRPFGSNLQIPSALIWWREKEKGGRALGV